jgi:hypothetical protein
MPKFKIAKLMELVMDLAINLTASLLPDSFAARIIGEVVSSYAVTKNKQLFSTLDLFGLASQYLEQLWQIFAPVLPQHKQIFG